MGMSSKIACKASLVKFVFLGLLLHSYFNFNSLFLISANQSQHTAFNRTILISFIYYFCFWYCLVQLENQHTVLYMYFVYWYILTLLMQNQWTQEIFNCVINLQLSKKKLLGTSVCVCVCVYQKIQFKYRNWLLL